MVPVKKKQRRNATQTPNTKRSGARVELLLLQKQLHFRVILAKFLLLLWLSRPPSHFKT